MATDAATIAHVHTGTWQVAYAHIFPAAALRELSVEDRAGRWQEILTTPSSAGSTLVAEQRSDVVGFASVGPAREEPARVGELYAIYVHPDSWGLGVGRALMAESLARLRGEGFSEAILWVLEDNPRTRRFYELAGWRADGGLKDETWLETPVREVRYRIALEPAA